MDLVRVLLVELPLLLVLMGMGQARAQVKPTVSRAYLDSAKGIRIVYADGEQVQPLREKDQASCESLKLAEDKQTVGWLVDYESDGTTYPVALTLIVFRDKKVLRRFDSDLDPIEDWHFQAGGKQVAFVTNALHGGGRAHYELHDSAKGTLLAKWDGPLNQQSPAWLRGLWDEDAN